MQGRSSGHRAARTAKIALIAAAAVLLSGLTLASPAKAAFSASTGGVVLDLYGGIHPFGGANIDTTAAPYYSWDIARAVDVLPDGSGGWTLDGWGGIHNWGSAPSVDTPFYAVGQDLARGLVVLPDEQSGYLLDAYGGVHRFGSLTKAPAFPTPFGWAGWDIARGIAVAADGTGAATGGWVMDGFGGVHTFGSPPAATGDPAYYGGRDVWQKLHLGPGGALYAVGRWGVVSDPGLAPAWSGYADWGGWNATRDVVLFSPASGTSTQPASLAAQQQFLAASAPPGGVVLDLFGGLHPFGGYQLDSAGAPYWSGWDIARGLALLPDGSGGWTLDGWGGIHNWGNAPAIAQPTLWPNWDIARAVVILPDRQSGYLLDGFGGVHGFGPNAPAFVASAYWSGQDMARGLEVAIDASGRATGGWVMDGFGGLHPFGSVPANADPVALHPGHDVWRKLHLSLDGRHLYGVGRYGIVSAPGMSPNWTGYQDWGGWDATRDVVIGNPLLGGGQAVPLSPAAQAAFTLAATASNGIVAKPGCGAYGWAPPAGKWVVISLECAELGAYQDGQLVADMLITTGRPALPTERGHTRVLTKSHPFLMISPWPRGSQYYYNPSWVQYVTWIWPNGTGIHDAYWEPDRALGPGSNLGPYASHGCVHVTLPMAQWIYYWADIGTPVDVV
jgi:lipoprotein-anchoring transpeptidase ErfK/SrfK